MTDYLGIRHTFLTIDDAVPEREFLRQLYCFEELWGNPQVPMMELYKKERELGTTVSLDGHAADELFAGYGSQAMALKRAGAKFEHYRVVEFDKYAIKSYNAVHGTDFPAIDITTVHAADLGIVDTNDYCYMMTYSFPCTDLSVAGLQKGMKKGSGTRSGLLWEVERLLKEMNELPQILFMENVTQVHNQQNIEYSFRKRKRRYSACLKIWNSIRKTNGCRC